MRRSSPQSLGEILKSVTKSMGLDSRMAEGQVIAAWEDIQGEQMRRQIKRSWLQKDVLFVEVASPAWRHELHLDRKAWCERLNNELGREAVREIVFR
jgi:predicted nucleic acid-binding Zn ribbon protein